MCRKLKLKIMAIALRTQSCDSVGIRQATGTNHEPNRLSKFGIWRRENPGGLYEVIDRRAVNKLKR